MGAARPDGIRPVTWPAWRSELASLGPYFALEVIDGTTEADGRLETLTGGVDSAPWQPLSALVDDPQVLDARVRAVANALRPFVATDVSPSAAPAVPDRVAASVTHLGIVARLISPWLGARALGHPWTPLRSGELRWRDVLGGPLPLAVDLSHDVRARRATDILTGTAVEEITVRVIERYRLGDHVGWGNVASAANGAAMMLARHRADLADAAHRAADAILADARVEGGALRSGEGFRRRSCCLIYRLTGGPASICGDCVLGAQQHR